MNKLILLNLVLVSSFLFSVGCSALLLKHPAPNSALVQSGIATTNDAILAAYLKGASAVNAAIPLAPVQAPIAIILASITALISAAAGFWGRHVAGKASTENAARIAEIAASALREKNGAIIIDKS